MEQEKHNREVNSEDSARDNKNAQNETGENELKNDELESVVGGANRPYMLDDWYHVECTKCGYKTLHANNFFTYNSDYLTLKEEGCPNCGLTDHIKIIKE
jgi:hypothetical protein